MSSNVKNYDEQGGAVKVIGGELRMAAGSKLTNDGTQASALTAKLTDITHTVPGTPDYAIQDLVQNTGFGFVTADEGNTVLKVIANLQTRVNELEAALKGIGALSA